jgi:hypothetical protein
VFPAKSSLAATGTQLYEPETGDKLSGWTVEGIQIVPFNLSSLDLLAAGDGERVASFARGVLPCNLATWQACTVALLLPASTPLPSSAPVCSPHKPA